MRSSLPPLNERFLLPVLLVVGLVLPGAVPSAHADGPRVDASPPPATVSGATIVAPTTPTVRSSTTGGNDSLTVAYEYTTGGGASPDSVTVRLTTGADTAAYTVADGDYGGGGAESTVTVDLPSPDSTGGSGLVDGQTYDLQFIATDTNDDTGTAQATEVLTIDNSAPSSLAVEAPTDSTFTQPGEPFDVTYSYQDAHPDSVTITLDDGTNTATFGVADSGYEGDNSTRTVTLDLSAPSTGSVSAGTTYDLTVTARDSAGNSASASAPNRLTVDDTPPEVTSITRSAPAPDTTNANSVTFSVAFSEAIENIGGSDFGLSGSLAGSASVSNTSAGNGRSVDVTVSSISGDGTLNLDVADGDGDVTDRAGNALSSPSPTGTEETYTIDNTAPSITNVTTPSNTSYAEGENVPFTVTYDEVVEVTTSGGTPTLPLSIDGTSQDAAYTSGSGSTTLTFTYAAQPGDSTLALTASSLQLGGGVIADPVGNDANLTFDGAGPDLSTVGIDGTAPTLGPVSLGVTNGNELDLRFQSTEPLPTLTVDVNGPGGYAQTLDRSQFTTSPSPDPQFAREFRLSAAVSYGDGGTYKATIEAAVDSVGNDGAASATEATYTRPTAQNDNLATGEDSPISESAPGLLDNDSPSDPGALAVVGVNGTNEVGNQISLSSGARLTLDANGAYDYNPTGALDNLADGETGTDSFTYTVEGTADGGTDQATVTVDLTGTNDPTTVTDEALIVASIGGTEPLTTDELQATDPDNTASDLQFTLTSTPSAGTLQKSGSALGTGGTFTLADLQNSRVTYTHDGSSTNNDEFQFTVRDNAGFVSETQTLDIFINIDNTPPTTANDNASTSEDAPLSVAAPGVLGNDSDADNDALTVSEVEGQADRVGENVGPEGEWTLRINADGAYSFDPSGAFDRLDAGDSESIDVAYTASDDIQSSDATLTVTVSGANDVPSLSTNNAVTVGQIGGEVPITDRQLSADDPDDDDGPAAITYALDAQPDQGTVTVNGTEATTFTQQELNNNNVRYKHTGSTTGTDSFTFDLSDGTGTRADLTYTINIEAGTPTATDDQYSIAEDNTLSVPTPDGVLANDSDPDGDNLTASVSSIPSSAESFNLNSDGSFTYVPEPDSNGTDQFVYTATDPDGNTDNATVTIAVTPVNDPPTLTTNQPLPVDERTTQPLQPSVLSASDVDDPPENIVYEVTSAPSQGRLLVGGSEATRFTQQALEDGQVAYEHTASTTNDDQFSLRLTDDDGAAPTSLTVDVQVQASNNSPIVTADRYVTRQGQRLTVSTPAAGVLGNDRDPDGSIATVVVTDSADDGTVALDQNTGTFTYTPDPGFDGEDEFQYEATDNVGGDATGRVSIRVRPAQATASIDRVFPNPTQKQSFRLVALPGSAAVALPSTLSGARGDQWRAFRETGGTDSTASGRRACGPNTNCMLGPGSGYWLISRSSWSISDSVETVSLAPGSSATAPPVYRIPLHDGWNVISNPLTQAVSWGAVQAASGTQQPLYRWDGAWSETRTFASAASGEAYYFRDDRLDTLVVPYPDLRRAAASKTSDKTPSSARRALSLHAVQDGDTLATLRAGRRPGSKPGLDRTDRYAPPSYFGPVSLHLMADGENRPQALRAEYKPPGHTGYTYDVRLRAPSSRAVRLVARGLEAVGNEKVALVRRSSGRPHNLRTDSSITVPSGSGTTRFRLLVGSAAFVDEARRDLAPETVTLRPNYPNPFRRTTTLEYSLPERQSVRLTVYDLLGRRVQVLANGKKRAGFHRLQWAGTAGGRPLASGTYFVRLVAGSTTKTERLVIVR